MGVRNLIYSITMNINNRNIIIKKFSKISKKTIFEDNCKVNRNCSLFDSYIGRGSYIGENSKLNNCVIGRFCSISSGVEIITGTHPTSIFVSTHPAFYSIRKQSGFSFTEKQLLRNYCYADNDSKVSVIIGNDVWIGQGVKILEGVKIGDGAIIGAGALVTKNIELYSINTGIPSKIRKYRFDKKYIDFLLDFQWWSKDFSWIKTNYEYFSNIELFYKHFNTNI